MTEASPLPMGSKPGHPGVVLEMLFSVMLWCYAIDMVFDDSCADSARTAR